MASSNNIRFVLAELKNYSLGTGQCIVCGERLLERERHLHTAREVTAARNNLPADHRSIKDDGTFDPTYIGDGAYPA